MIHPLFTPYKVTQEFFTPWFFNRSVTHKGRDYAAPYGTDVYAAGGGTMKRLQYDEAYGWFIEIDHGWGLTSLYAHFDRPSGFKVGDKVFEDTKIGVIGDTRTGQTGTSTGPHLHFEIRLFGIKVNPLNYLTIGREDYMTQLTKLEERMEKVEGRVYVDHEKNISRIDGLVSFKAEVVDFMRWTKENIKELFKKKKAKKGVKQIVKKALKK